MVRARKSFVLGYTANGWQTQSSDLLLDDVRTNACDQRNETRAYGFQVTRQRLSFSRISTISRLSYSRRFCFSTSASDPNSEKGVLMLDCQGLSIPWPPLQCVTSDFPPFRRYHEFDPSTPDFGSAQ